MRFSGVLWIWKETTLGEPGSGEISSRPTPRKLRHWLVIFTPTLWLLITWLLVHFVPIRWLPSIYEIVDLLRWLVFLSGCFALGFWWRRRWVGDRFGHSVMAGLAVFAFNIGIIGAAVFLLMVAAAIATALF